MSSQNNRQVNAQQKTTESTEVAEGTELNRLRAELELAHRKMDDYLNGWKRAKADYINFKRETEKRESEVIQYASAAVILEILPIYNNFKLAWQHIPKEHQKNDEWLKGIEQIKNQFATFLKNIGIEEIKTVGEKFNPQFHEAVAKEKVEGKESGTILEEIGAGYKMHNNVIEHAKVKVAE